MPLDEWADRYRIMGGRSGEGLIPYRSSTTPYCREVMRLLTPGSGWHRVITKFGIQTGKTTIAENLVAYAVAYGLGRVLMVRPTIEECQRFKQFRIDPMISASPTLTSKVPPLRSRDGGNRMLAMTFPGGVFLLAGANVAMGLKSEAIRVLIGDEIDEWPGEIEGQGDPLALAEGRMVGPNFARRIEYLTSTPTVKGLSRIDAEWEKSDQREYFVPCPHCGALDYLDFEKRFRFDPKNPSDAHVICLACGSEIEERYKASMHAEENGARWQPTAPGDGITAGFHITSMSSPWYPWKEFGLDSEKAKTDPVARKAFRNMKLAEAYEDVEDSVEPAELLKRCEEYAAEVPHGVGTLVAAADVQQDRLECGVWGFGVGFESWLIAYSVFHGNPGDEGATVWNELDAFLKRKFDHESGQKVGIDCVTIDSGGQCSQRVYEFCKSRFNRRIFAVRGGNVTGKPLVTKPTRNNRYRAALYTLCTDTGKEIVRIRLCTKVKGPGYVHHPHTMTLEYFEQLLNEKPSIKWIKGKGSIRIWKKTFSHVGNEPFDIQVYGIAALDILGSEWQRTLPERVAALSRAFDPPGGTATQSGGDSAPLAPTPFVKRKTGDWMRGYGLGR